MSYKRVNHPSEVINIGDTVKVQIVRINHDTQRISLGMKQLESDPWDAAAAKYPVGAKLTGRVTNITEYGAFVELEAGIEGLVHVSEMSLDQEERPPRQDRFDQPGSRSHRPRSRRRSAFLRRLRGRCVPTPGSSKRSCRVVLLATFPKRAPGLRCPVLLQFDKGAVFGDVRHAALGTSAAAVMPGIGFQLLHAEADALGVAVDADDLDAQDVAECRRAASEGWLTRL